MVDSNDIVSGRSRGHIGINASALGRSQFTKIKLNPPELASQIFSLASDLVKQR